MSPKNRTLGGNTSKKGKYYMERSPFSSLAAGLLLLAFSTSLLSAEDALFSSNFESQEQDNNPQFCDIFFTDSDGDDYGSNDAGTEVCSSSPAGPSIPSGMSDNNLDCDDNNANANPGQVESRPNNSFADENCDGVDGNPLNAIFVSETYGSDSNFSCGTQSAPCQSISRGISRLSFTGKTQLYVAEGTYDDALDLESDVEIYGGYDEDNWSRSATNDSIVVGELSYPKGYAIQIEPNVTVVLNNLVLTGPDAHTNSSDMNSYVVYAKSGSHLTVDGSELRQGNGRNGTHGDNGSSADQSRAPSGVNGSAGQLGSESSCDLNRSGGGAGGINTCAANYTAGGSGGLSGQEDTRLETQFFDKCITEALPGNVGGPAGTFSNNQFGFGGGSGSGLEACGIPTPGGNGQVVDGTPGSAGTGGSLNSSALWFSGRGGNGVIGQNGTGGGGGGGAGGCDVIPQAHGGGGGGGGAGGCSASAGGTGGFGGGGSFGIFISDGTLVVKNTLFKRGVGGKGGHGGNGGSGQPGGFGGAGGNAAGTAVAGAPGGMGGRGGHSGGGGGGAGGPSCGILAHNSSVNRSHNNLYQQGQGGTGGNGGGGPVTGTKGQNGSLCEAINQ